MKSIHPAKLIYQFLLFQTSWLPFAATTHSLVVKQEWFFICCQLFSGLWLSVLVVSVHSFQCKKKILSPQLKSNPAFSQHFQVLRSSPTFSWISDFLFSSFFNISLKSTGAPFQHQLFPVFSLFAALLFGQRANLGLAMWRERVVIAGRKEGRSS